MGYYIFSCSSITSTVCCSAWSSYLHLDTVVDLHISNNAPWISSRVKYCGTNQLVFVKTRHVKPRSLAWGYWTLYCIWTGTTNRMRRLCSQPCALTGLWLWLLMNVSSFLVCLLFLWRAHILVRYCRTFHHPGINICAIEYKTLVLLRLRFRGCLCMVQCWWGHIQAQPQTQTTDE